MVAGKALAQFLDHGFRLVAGVRDIQVDDEQLERPVVRGGTESSSSGPGVRGLRLGRGGAQLPSGAWSLVAHAANSSRHWRSASVRPPGRTIVIVADEDEVLPGKARSIAASVAWTDGALSGRNDVWSVDPSPAMLGASCGWKHAPATIQARTIRKRSR